MVVMVAVGSWSLGHSSTVGIVYVFYGINLFFGINIYAGIKSIRLVRTGPIKIFLFVNIWRLFSIYSGINKTVRIETYTSRFGGKVLTDEKSHDFFNVPKLHPTHRWKRPLPISLHVPS